MVTRAGSNRRTWPLWLLGLAMLLLVLSILLMQRSYRQQLDASMAQLQHSVAVARLQQERLAARLHDRPPPGPAAADRAAAAEAALAEAARPAPIPPRDQPAALAGRLQRVANELDLLARDGGTSVPSRAEWLDWSRVRAELWAISRALRQYRPAAPSRPGANPASLRDWVSRAQSAANQQQPAALITALSGIQQQLAARGRADPDAERLARRTARLSAVLGSGGLSAVDRQQLDELARETSAIAQRVSTLSADSVAHRSTGR